MTTQKKPQANPQANPADTDFKNLHKKFVQLGRQRNHLLNEMLAILPEIHGSGIWKKYASSIVEYAGKFGGISKSAVLKRLRLEKHLQNKPNLKSMIKEVGVNKIAMVATLASDKTDEAFADKVRHMSKSAIGVMAKELRAKTDNAGRAGSQNDLFQLSSACSAVPVKIKLELNEEMSFLFMKLRGKWGVGNTEVMKLLIDRAVASEFVEKKVSVKAMRTQTMKKIKSVTGDKIARSASPRNLANVKCVTGDKIARSASPRKLANVKSVTGGKIVRSASPRKLANVKSERSVKSSRYINAYQKRAILSKTGGKCDYTGCNKPAEQFHHIDRWYKSKNHKNVIPLCRDHHEFPHNGLIKNEHDDWELAFTGMTKEPADRLYRERHRKPHAAPQIANLNDTANRKNGRLEKN